MQKTNSLILSLYATDASMYQMQPLEVLVPLDRADLLNMIRRCAEQKLPLLARGGGLYQMDFLVDIRLLI
jgi:FAD/FMN-containing dehydrogenase